MKTLYFKVSPPVYDNVSVALNMVDQLDQDLIHEEKDIEYNILTEIPKA